jgi:site-specific DNA recombinase
VVRAIFTWVATEGLSLRAVARRLNERGVPAPSIGKREYDRPILWRGGTVNRIVARPEYKGETILWRTQQSIGEGGRRLVVDRPAAEWVRLPDGVTPAIVTPALWNQAQVRTHSNNGDQTRNELRPYLLRGMVTCSVCHRTMYPDTGKGNVRLYRCSSRTTPHGACGARSVNADAIEAYVWEQVAWRLKHPDIIEAEAERRRVEGPDPLDVSSLESARRELARVERQQEKLVRAYAMADDSDFPVDVLQRELARCKQERTRLEETVTGLEHRLAYQQAASDRRESLYAFCAIVANNLDSFGFAERREALEACEVHVSANGREWTGTGRIFPAAEGGELFTASGQMCAPVTVPSLLMRGTHDDVIDAAAHE